MRRTNQRSELIAEVKARHRAAGQKVSRLERNGVRVRRDGLDPRREAPQYDAMSSRQLRSYLTKLNRFTDRGNGYVAGLHGTPISAKLWHEYQRLERQQNRNVAKYEQNIANIAVPGTGMTIAERMAMLKRGKGVRGDYRTFSELHRDVSNLTGDEAVQKYIKGMQKRLNPDYLKREMATQRKILGAMLKTSGDKDVLKVVKGMSDEQLNILVGYTTFMKDVGARYAMAMSINSDTPRWQSQVHDTATDKIRDLADWASDLPTSDVDGTVRSGKPPVKSRTPRFDPDAPYAGTLPEFRKRR